MKIKHNHILTFLSKQLVFKDILINREKLRIDILNREEILSLYSLRLEIAIEKRNEEGIETCTEIIKKISQMQGENLYSICYNDNNIKVIGFVDEYIKMIYTFPIIMI